MMQMLRIGHLGEVNGKPQFQVQRADGKTAAPVCLTPPDTICVKGRPQSNLLLDLSWYLEKFLDLPYGGNLDVAERVKDAIRDWGIDIFNQLFGAGRARDWYHDARRAGMEQLQLKIASDDPRVLAWPWEALRDPEGTTLAHTCRIERQLNQLHDPLPLPDQLARNRINILLVIARPYGENDVGYHALSRPLVEQVRDEPGMFIDVLRPPTFAQLRETLQAKRGFYHIIHFDGHGGYGHSPSHGTSHSFQGPQGRLVFEDSDGNPDPIEAELLTPLLTEYRIPVMVLNACQSARIDAQADDPFASVAAALLKAGIRSVVAMGYNLYVSAAQQFVPGFYQRLIRDGDVAEAVRAGRQTMLAKPNRICAVGEYPLDDWLVPVLYQQDPITLPRSALTPCETVPPVPLPDDALESGNYRFIGRERAIHDLDRALIRQEQAGVLIHGMAGIGKTTLVRGLLKWLQDTHGLGVGVAWFSFDDIRSGESVINRLVEKLAPHANAMTLEQKLPLLIEALRKQPWLMVWDNFESAAGIAGTEVTPLLTEQDRLLLKDFLQKLRGGKTKVLITSRSPEKWLPISVCYRLPLSGLEGEERWLYCNAVIRDLGLTVDRKDEEFGKLMEALDGHPLAMRAVLLRLAEKSAAELLAELERQFQGTQDDESTSKIFAALKVFDRGLPTEYEPVLQLMGLHQRYMHIDDITAMLEYAETKLERPVLQNCFDALEQGGLLHRIYNHVYHMHPALSAHLRVVHPTGESLQIAFVTWMTSLSNQLAPKPRHEQLGSFQIHSANFYGALALAKNLQMHGKIAALIQALAIFAQNTRNYVEAKRLFTSLAKHSANRDEDEGDLATAYHHIGRIAEEQRDFSAAEHWYHKALAIKVKLGDEHDAALAYHHLGIIAQERRDFGAAEHWYQKALAIDEKLGDEHGAAATYHNLGVIAQKQRNFSAAEQWYRKSLTIKEKCGDEHRASTYCQLGRIAEEQRDFSAAEQEYHKARAILEKLGDEHRAASIYQGLGSIAEKQRDFDTAEQWYQKALAIFDKLGDEYRAASIYHNLGGIAEEQLDFSAAEKWYKKSLAIIEKYGDEHGGAGTYHQLGRIAEEQRDFSAAEQWYKKSLAIKEKYGDKHGAAGTYHQLGRIAEEQRDFSAAEQGYHKALAIFEKLGDEHHAAFAYHQLGRIAEEQQAFELAGQWYIKAMVVFLKSGETNFIDNVATVYVRNLQKADEEIQATLRKLWQEAGFQKHLPLQELEKKLYDTSDVPE